LQDSCIKATKNKFQSQIPNKGNVKGSNLKKIIEGLKLKKGHELLSDCANQSLMLAKKEGIEHFFKLQIQFSKL